jgi:hypothetical protein
MVEVIDALEIQMQSAVTAVAPNPTAAATLREETMARVATIVFFLGLVPVLVLQLHHLHQRLSTALAGGSCRTQLVH